MVNVGGTFVGVCTFSDKDGDMIFVTFTGDPVKNEGQVKPTGGSGKYKGITGTGKWKCDGGKKGGKHVSSKHNLQVALINHFHIQNR